MWDPRRSPGMRHFRIEGRPYQKNNAYYYKFRLTYGKSADIITRLGIFGEKVDLTGCL